MDATRKWWPIAPEGAATLLIRFSIGMLFLIAGLNKFFGEGGPAGAANWIISDFKDTILPSFVVVPFAYVLPYLEALIGVVLIIGVLTPCAFTVSGLLLIVLAFGMAIKQQHAVVANNLNYAFIAAIGLWLSGRDNRYSLGALFKKK